MEQEYGLNSNKPLLLKKMQEKHPETLFISLLDHQLPNGTYYSLYEGNNLFNEHVEFVNFLAKKHKTKRILLCGSSAGGSFALKLGAKLLLKVLVFSPQYNIEAYGNSVQNKALTILEYHKYYEIPSFIPKEYIQVLKEHNLLVYVYSDIDPDSNQNLTEEFNTNEPCFIKCMDEHKDVLENNLDILHNSLLLL